MGSDDGENYEQKRRRCDSNPNFQSSDSHMEQNDTGFLDLSLSSTTDRPSTSSAVPPPPPPQPLSPSLMVASIDDSNAQLALPLFPPSQNHDFVTGEYSFYPQLQNGVAAGSNRPTAAVYYPQPHLPVFCLPGESPSVTIPGYFPENGFPAVPHHHHPPPPPLTVDLPPPSPLSTASSELRALDLSHTTNGENPSPFSPTTVTIQYPYPYQENGGSNSVSPAATPRQPPPPRGRRSATQSPREGKSLTIPAKYPWSTDRRATVQTLNYLLSNNITTISGELHCKRCDKTFETTFDLCKNFREIGTFIAQNKAILKERAPQIWTTPTLPNCTECNQENCAKPVIAEKKKFINWLFLLLGQLLGCCTLDQLKYFCKHTNNHRTGAKDRVLYLAYLGLCKQLDPEGPFNRTD